MNSLPRILRPQVERWLGIISLTVLSHSSPGQAADLFISEYLEGSASNKALEVFNGTGAQVDLTAYAVALYSNGAATAGSTINLGSLQPSLADGAVITLLNGGFAGTVAGNAYAASPINFNGDDAIALLKDGVVIDVIGEIGVRENAFANTTLRRASTIDSPATVYDETQWLESGLDDFSDLGQHTFEGSGEPDPEPSAYPTAWLASAGNDGSITLSWIDSLGENLPRRYLVYVWENTAPALPIDGIPVNADLDFSDGSGVLVVDFGTQTLRLDTLAFGTTYQFRIIPFSNGGTASDFKTDGVPPETLAQTASVALGERFETLDNWTIVTLGSDPEWALSNGVAAANAFGSSGPADDWLVSNPIALGGLFDPVLRFEALQGFDDTGFNPALSVLVSTDYDGTGTPTAVQNANWVRLDFPTLLTAPASLTRTGEVSLSAFGETVYLAFRYESSGNLGNTSESWSVDNVLIFGTGLEPVAVSLDLAENSLTEGAQASGMVTLSRAPDEFPFVVALASSDTTELSVPPSVTFLSVADGLSQSFIFNAQADGLYDSDASVTLTASVGGSEVSRSVEVINADPAPPLSVSAQPTSLLENAGPQASSLTITLPVVPLSGFPFSVTLASSSLDEATLPAEVVFQESDNLVKTVPIAAQTDGEVDGNQTVTIRASSSEFPSASVSIEVVDVDTETGAGVLTLSLDRADVIEGGSATGTIRLSRAPDEDLVVMLSTTDANEATVPSQLTIAAGHTVATFHLQAELDGVIDEDKQIGVLASATDWVGAEATVLVRNIDVPREATLRLTVDTLTEGDALTAELRLNVPVLTTSLVNFLPNADLILPENLSIEAGSAVLLFQIQAMAGDGFEPEELTTLTVTLSGYPDARANLTILNTDARGRLLMPDDSVTLLRGQSITLQAEAADPIGTLEGVRFSVDGVAVGLDAEPPFELEFVIPREGAVGQMLFSAEAVDAVLGTEVLGQARGEVVFNPILVEGDFVEQTYFDLTGEKPGSDLKDSLLFDLGSSSNRWSWVASFLNANGASHRAAIQTRLLVLDRFPAFDELQNDRGISADMGIVGLANMLFATEEAEARFGAPVSTLNTTAFFTPVWRTRHGVSPTAQQIVQASSRIANYPNGRADFIRGLIEEETFGAFAIDIIFNPPASRLEIDSKAALARLILWNERETFGRAEVLSVTEGSLAEYIKGLLRHPAYWERFGYAWLNATEFVQAPDWFLSDWFGAFSYNRDTWPWAFHLNHGWIAVGSDNAQARGAWWYDLELGWLFSSPTAYPWVYQSREQAWLWYFEGSTHPRYFYNTQTETWIEAD